MIATEKNDIEATVRILERLDKKSLLLINSGAKLLAARQDMEKEAGQTVAGSIEGR